MKNNLREQNLKNLNTEKIGIQILREDIKGFMVPSKEQRKHVYELCDIDYKKYSRSIDGIIINVESFDLIESKSDFYFVEIKTTNAKNVTNLPYNVFFGFTKIVCYDCFCVSLKERTTGPSHPVKRAFYIKREFTSIEITE